MSDLGPDLSAEYVVCAGFWGEGEATCFQPLQSHQCAVPDRDGDDFNDYHRPPCVCRCGARNDGGESGE